jgi:hypothetical protein
VKNESGRTFDGGNAHSEAPEQRSPYVPEPRAKLAPTRRQRRARDRQVQAKVDRQPRRYAHETGRARLARWQRDSWVELVRQANRLGIQLETVADRKRVIIALQHEQADRIGVERSTWACMTRKQRGAAVDLGVGLTSGVAPIRLGTTNRPADEGAW